MVRKGVVRAKKTRMLQQFHNKHVPQLSSVISLTCPKGGSLPVVVVVGEAGEAWHAACIIVLEPLEEFSQFLSALLLLLQPLSLLL